MSTNETRPHLSPRPAAGPQTVIASARGVEKRYDELTALAGVDLELHAGEVLGLLGPNGAGKTTLVGLLLGLLRSDAGTVEVFGSSPRSATARTRSGVMLQLSSVPETLTVREHLDLQRSYYPRPLDLDTALEAAGATELADRRFGRLSGGQQQRALFALALCGDPDLLILDEPTVGLDAEARRALWRGIDSMAADGKSVLLTTHYLDEADALSSRIVVLSEGRIVADGTPAEVKSRVRTSTIRCTTNVSIDEVSAWPGVDTALATGSTATAGGGREPLELVTTRPEGTVRRLLASDPVLADLEVRRSSLEDALLALTRHEEAADRAVSDEVAA